MLKEDSLRFRYHEIGFIRIVAHFCSPYIDRDIDDMQDNYVKAEDYS